MVLAPTPHTLYLWFSIAMTKQRKKITFEAVTEVHSMQGYSQHPPVLLLTAHLLGTHLGVTHWEWQMDLRGQGGESQDFYETWVRKSLCNEVGFLDILPI